MISDPVWGLRRRPSTYLKNTIVTGGHNDNSIKAGVLNIGDAEYHYLINTVNGKMDVYNTAHRFLSSVTNSYLIASDANKLQIANVSGYGWVANTDKVPAKATTNLAMYKDPTKTAFLFIKTGAFSKSYTATIKLGTKELDIGYTTPTGSSSAQALQATPAAIAGKLYDSISAGFTTDELTVVRTDAYIWMESANGQPLEIISSSDKVYYVVSGRMFVQQNIDIPEHLPAEANGAVLGVGLTQEAMVYYTHKRIGNKSYWTECAEYGSANVFTNMPLRIKVNNNVLTLEADLFEGRVSGNDKNNPYPHFLETGITGISAYQSRLIILSGAFVLLSASNKATRVMRSTVTTLRDDDPIEVGSGALTSANFEWAVPVNRDVMLFSKTHQAVLTSGNTGITARNAQIAQTSTQVIDTSVRPVMLDRNMLYVGRSADAFMSVGEVVPSEYTDSFYTPRNLTDHLPTYMVGTPKEFVGSTTNNLVLLVADNRKDVYVYEYLWQGNERVVQSWHKWRFEFKVVSLYFYKNTLVILFSDATRLFVCEMSPRTYTTAGDEPHADIISRKVIAEGGLVPEPYALPSDNLVVMQTDTRAPEIVGIKNLNGGRFNMVNSFVDGTYDLGYKFESLYVLPRPVPKDRNDKPMHNVSAIIYFKLGMRNSGYFEHAIKDQHTTSGITQTTPLMWSGVSLTEQRIDTGDVHIPIRYRNTYGLELHLKCNTTMDMNILDVEYGVKLATRFRRAT